ncbi:DUF6005 family protein [Alkalihalophilus pseudofirmus]|uniref:DUF6005 family protein n=1 Tax=Alkalihalophilus pseudofirmus TaxID=79885 RepID=UPI00259BCB8F|nr:DUF6005 family protein [Alkalihalophilus pseudofirmus]WEG17160.1 DUF6005 family protein [Alkalihalophilus pseudofirmus]
MIKVHCFVSCVCEVIKKNEGLDHRPFYFGVWDADFDITEDYVLSYHSEIINHDFFCTWYEHLYGIKLNRWYQDELSKEENVENMLKLMEDKPSGRHLMVMLDLSLLPERENKFHQRPFPHYVMLDTTSNPEEWMMFDPDFRWEGTLLKKKILNAIMEPTVGGGYYFDERELVKPTDETIEAYFNTCLKLDCNPMTEGIRSIVAAFTEGERSNELHELGNSLKQIPVLAIRKYAYEHAFAYFFNELELDEEEFEMWCDEIERLVKGYTTVQYRAMKLAMTRDEKHQEAIHMQLDHQDKRETAIKHALKQYFEKWSNRQNQVGQDNMNKKRLEEEGHQILSLS